MFSRPTRVSNIIKRQLKSTFEIAGEQWRQSGPRQDRAAAERPTHTPRPLRPEDNTARVRERRRHEPAHGLHSGGLEPSRHQLQDPRGGQAQEQADRGQDYPGDSHHHLGGRRPRLLRADEARAGLQHANALQEWFR